MHRENQCEDTEGEDRHVTGVRHLHERMPGIASKCQRLEEARKYSLLEPSERSQLCQCLDFGFLTSRMERR